MIYTSKIPEAFIDLELNSTQYLHTVKTNLFAVRSPNVHSIITSYQANYAASLFVKEIHGNEWDLQICYPLQKFDVSESSLTRNHLLGFTRH